MANTDAPVGLWPRLGVGGDATPRMREYSVADAYTSAIGMGGVVQLSAGGAAERLRANSVSVILGVAAHFVSRTGTSRKLMVFDDPDTIFEIQIDDASITGIADCVGANFSLLNFNTYHSTNQRSIAEIDGGTGSNVVAARPVRCIGVSKRIDKDEFSSSWTGLIVKLQPSLHVWGKSAQDANTI